MGNALRFGIPILLAAIWGVARALQTDRLGGDESAGMSRTCLVLGMIVAPLLTAAFVWRAYGSLADAMDELGGTRLLFGFAGIAILGLVPTALGVYGFMSWLNGVGIADRAQAVDCTAGSAWHRTRKGADLGWNLPYSCDVDGEHLLGRLEASSRPVIAEGATFKIRAARGRFGYWVRLEEPSITQAAAPSP